MDLGYDVVVMITGIVLVFLILVLLMAIISVEGKVFDNLDKKKKEKTAAAEAAVSQSRGPAPAPVKQAATPAVPAPEVEDGIPGEIIAVIAAAVAALSGGKYTLRAVRRAHGNNWGRAGVNDTTSPF